MTDAAGRMQFGILGALEVRRDGRPLVLQGGAQRALLAALLLDANRPVPVERLIDELWGAEAGAGALKRLQVAVSRLRRVLDPGAENGRGEPVLATESGGYVLRVEPGALDAERFERLVDEGRAAVDDGRPETATETLRAALDLWRGPALADVSYERFAQTEILRLEELRLVARESRIEADLRLGRHVELVPELEALAAEHPDREQVTGQLMLALYRSGRQAAALAAFQRTRAYLADELGLEPAPALRALQARVLNHDASLDGREQQRSPTKEIPLALPPGLPAGGGLVGRAHELAGLRRGWEAATRPFVVLIAGPAGVGKSRLAARLAHDVRRVGSAVLYGRCDEEPLAPYQPFTEALRHLVAQAPSLLEDAAVAAHVAELARLLPELEAVGPSTSRGTDADADRHRLFEAVTTLISAGAGSGRPLLVIDDVHWADKPTLLMLRYVLRRVAVPLTVLATARDGADEPALGETLHGLRRDGALERLNLSGLSAEATEQLIAARAGGAPDPRFVQWAHGRTDGNPFFIEELLRAVSDAGVTDAVFRPDETTLASVGVPDGVKELVAQRLGRLGAATADVLRIAALIGAEFDLVLLEHILESREEALAATEAAIASRLIAETSSPPGGFRFAHALAREAVCQTMTAARRASLHQRIAEALESAAAPSPPAMLAHHFLEARALAGSSRGVHYAIAAAEEAGRALAWEEEIGFYTRALRALDDDGSEDDETRCRILLAIADLQVTVGNVDSRAAHARAASIAKRRKWGRVLAAAAVGSARTAEYGVFDEQAAALLGDALAVLGDADLRERARVLARLAEVLYHEPESAARRDALSREALQLARHIGDPTGLVAVLNGRAYAIGGPDRIHERIGLLTEAVELSDIAREREWTLSAYSARAPLHMELGDTAAASADIDALARLVGALGLSGNYNEADIARLRATQTLLAGHLEESERFARAAHERFTGVGEPDADKVLAAQLLPVRIEQNRGPELAEAIEACATRSPAVAVWNAALCRLHALAGRTRQARDELRALAANDFAAIPRDADWLGTLVLLADACVELGELRLGESLERRLRPYADRNALIVYGTAVVGTVAGALGRLATSLQRLDDAVVQHEHALAFSEAMKAPGLAGHAAVDLAITLLRRDRPNAGPQAHRLLVRATEIAAERNLPRLTARLEPHDLPRTPA